MAADREPEVLWEQRMKVSVSGWEGSEVHDATYRVVAYGDGMAKIVSRVDGFEDEGFEEQTSLDDWDATALALLAAERSRLSAERGQVLEALRLSAEALTAVDRCTLYGPADVAREKIAAATASIRDLVQGWQEAAFDEAYDALLARLEAGGEEE